MTTLSTRISLSIIFCIWFFPLDAQDYMVKVDLISTDAGLSGVTSYSIEKDQNGFLWISTSNGLDRYNGTEFEFYARDEYYDDVITHIAASTNNELWLFSYNKNTNVFNQLDVDELSIFDSKAQKEISKTKLDSIRSFLETSDFFLVKTSSNTSQLFFTNHQGELWTYQSGGFNQLPGTYSGMVQKIVQFDDQYQLSVENSLLTVGQNGEIHNKITFPGPVFDFWTTSNLTTWVAALKAGSVDEYQLWKMHEDQTYQPFYLKSGSTVVNPTLIPEKGNFIYRNQAGLWILNTNGEILIFGKDGQLIKEINQLDKFNQTIRVLDVAEIEDLIFLSTDMGIIKLKVVPEIFKTLYTKPILNDSRGIAETQDGKLLFSENHLYELNTNNSQVKKIYSETSGCSIYAADSFLLVGNGYDITHSVFEKNLITGKIDYYPSYGEGVVYCMKPTSLPDQFWVGTRNGIGLIDRNQKDTIPFRRYNGFLDLKSSRVKHIHQNQYGNWLATDQGIFWLDEKKGVLKQFSQASGDLPFNHFNHIYEDSQGVFWLSTNGGGIIKWQIDIADNQFGSFQEFNTTSGLSHNIVYSIYEDSKNRLWISSNRGIVCMDKSSYRTKVFLEEDGLPHAEFNLTSHYQARDSALYFGGLGGLISFYPNDLELSFQTNTPLELISCEILNDQSIEQQDLMIRVQQAKEINLSRADFLELKFQLLDFSNDENHQYLYKIEGLSNQWTQTNNNIRIASLPYGHYRLYIKGGNIKTGWSNQELVVKLRVPKPFYLQSWFFAALVLMAGLFTWCFIKLRIRQLKKERTLLAKKVKERTKQIEADKITIEQQAQKLEVLDQLKTNFFTNITHELRTPLSLILAPASQLITKKNKPEQQEVLLNSIYHNAQHLLGLTDELLDLAKIEAGILEVKKEAIDIQRLLELILNRYYGFASYQHLNFSTQLSFPKDLFLKLDKKKTEKIVHNLLSNAFKFTSAQGSIQVHGMWEAAQLKLVVSDTGNGIEPADLPFIFDRYYQSGIQGNHLGIGGSGIGLAICKEYIQILEGTIEVISEPEKGTIFIVQIPAEKAANLDANTTPFAAIPVQKIEPIKATENGSIQNNKYRILIVEDNPELARYLSRSLVDSYTVNLAPNGKEAWQLLQKMPFDLLISDIMMPEMDGIELLTKVKAHQDYQQLPFLILTALSESREKMNALRLGVDDYLKKPFLVEELKIRIDNLLKRYTIRKTPGEYIMPTAKEIWLQTLERTTLELAKDADFTVVKLAAALNVSERKLFNKIKKLVGLPPGQYIREARLEMARKLLEQQKYETVAEVCYAVGFQKPSYFTQLFKKRFGHLPSKYFK